MVEVRMGLKIKIFRTDNGREYTLLEFKLLLETNGIIHLLYYSPQQNGVLERKNRIVVKMARCLLYEMKQPNSLWVKVVNTLVYLLNRIFARAII